MGAGRHERRSRRQWRHRLAALLVVNLAILTANALVLLHRDGTHSGSPLAVASPGPSSAVRTQQIEAVLASRARAVRDHDAGAFMSTIDPTQTAFVAAQQRLIANLKQVPIGEWSYVIDDRDVEVDAARTSHYAAPVYAPAITLSYTLKGFDAKPALLQQRFTFVQRPSGWLIGSDSDFSADGAPSGRGIWDYGTVLRATGKSSLVLGHPRSAGQLAMIAALADDAVAHVDEVWGSGWSRKVVVLVPDTQEELASIISEGNDLSEIAAVAVAQNAGGPNPGAEFGDRIILNPVNFAQLSAIGERVILRHEVTHVATRSVTGSIAPQWLVEGIADYVGYRDAGIAVPVVAHELAQDIHKGYRPTELPSDGDFTSSSSRLAQSYELAWMACRLIVAKKGEAGLVRLYKEVGLSKADTEEQALDKAFTDVLGLHYSAFVAQWRADVVKELS
jgi:hypothetical protein